MAMQHTLNYRGQPGNQTDDFIITVIIVDCQSDGI